MVLYRGSMHTILVILLVMNTAQFISAAKLTVCNFSDFTIMVNPICKTHTLQVMKPKSKMTFNSKHKFSGIRWGENVSDDEDAPIFSCIYTVTAQNKKEPYNKVFLASNRVGTFNIRNTGRYSYVFGGKDYGGGTASCATS